VIVGDIEDPRIQGQVRNRFEVVVLGDLLEHLKRPGALLKQIRDAWLTHDGRVVASVPNSGHWIFRREVLRGRFPYREYGLFDRTHLRFYTRSSFAALLERAGYRIEREAFAINSNSYEDITFLGLKPLYRRPAIAVRLHMVETRLAHLFPALFAYQFVVCARPKTALETRR
jgi:SAM-dependent methyltransferase